MNPTILLADARHIPLKDECVQTCITSPPYWGLRDYGIDGQLGLEQTPEEYVTQLVQVCQEIRRVLRLDGTLWLNLGDSYASSPAGNKTPSGFSQTRPSRRKHGIGPETVDLPVKQFGCKPKDLVGIPWLVAFALRADGWYLRSDIIWAKPNPMPESVQDRPTRSHEYIFLLSKSRTYFYDAEAIREPATYSTEDRRDRAREGNKSLPTALHNGIRPRTSDKQRGHSRRHAGFNDRWDSMSKKEQGALGRNKRSVWTVATKGFADAHFAVFPEKLIEPCVLAGSRPGDLVLDPFSGVGTTGMVAEKHGREYVGLELNPDYIALTQRRYGRGIQKALL